MPDKDKYKNDEIISAHEKQRNISRGQGGVILTPREKEILDNHVELLDRWHDFIVGHPLRANMNATEALSRFEEWKKNSAE